MVVVPQCQSVIRTRSSISSSSSSSSGSGSGGSGGSSNSLQQLLPIHII